MSTAAYPARSYNKKPYKKAYPYNQPVVKNTVRVNRNWSDYQKAIFNDIANGNGNTHVAALAGTGKTSTIVEGFHYIPKGKTTLMCAFNKSIQTELETRAPAGVEVKTLHAIGFAAIRRAFPNVKLDNKKLEGYVKAERGDEQETFEVRSNLMKCVSLCKGYLVETPETIDEIMDRHEIDPCGDKREEFIAIVIKIMKACVADTARIDFDDMVYIPNALKLNLPKYDFVFIDEAQDLNIAQINLALNSVNSGGRIISVGDTNQAIYGFRGADSNAIQNIIDRCQSKILPLSVTYRCAKAIVELANQLVPDLEAGPENGEGNVDYIAENQIEKLIKPGDFLLSRTNAPLLKWCLSLLKAGVPANIMGRDLGKTLSFMIKKSNAKSVEGFLDWLNDWASTECDRLAKAKRDTSVVEDKRECLQVLCDGAKTLEDVYANIDKLFNDVDDKGRVMCSTTHKAKGLERDRVFILSKTYKPSKGQEEANLLYVAQTRAKSNLYMVA
jgi:DNA helicase-2/ATP-dependent DNA helicase PcrA